MTGTKANGEAGGTTPGVDDVSNVWYVPQRAYITELTDPTVAIGDICKYLSGRPGVPAGKWRMPTYYETTGSYTQEYNSSGTWRTTSLTVPTTTIGHAGRYVPAGMWDGIRSDRIGTPFFPASGVRSETGSLSIWPAGVSGFYWNSNGGVGSGDGIHTVGVIHVAGTVPFGAGSQQHGANAVTVRCVRE